MVVSALFITWPSLFYSSHASLRSIHHMTVCSIHHMPVSILFITWQSAPFIIIMSVLHPTNHFSAYHLVNWATLTMQHLLASGMCMNNITFLCSLSLLITWWTMQHLLVFGMSMKKNHSPFFCLLITWWTMQRLLVSGMSMNNITFLCSLSLRNYLVNYATLIVFGMSMKNKS